MRHNLIETIMGGVVLLIAGFFLVFAYSSSGYKQRDGYGYFAQFDRIDGLNQGADVKISGVKVGVVRSLAIDPTTFLAKIEFTVAPDIKLPADSSAEIISDGLMGGKYVALVPGGDEANLKPGDQIKHTQSSVSLEGMIGQLIFSNKGGAKKEDPPSSAPTPGPATAQPDASRDVPTP
ncbi:MAG: outer membrane lipid asymmetry maintenance protein MlaD [Holosporales bacterium]